MSFKDFFFSFKNIHLSFLGKREIFKFIRVGISTLYKFFILDLFIYNFFYKKDLDKLSTSLDVSGCKPDIASKVEEDIAMLLHGNIPLDCSLYGGSLSGGSVLDYLPENGICFTVGILSHPTNHCLEHLYTLTYVISMMYIKP